MSLRTLQFFALAATLSAQNAPREWNKPFPPHKVIGNIYSIGTAELSTFLITTAQGHILINSDFETTVPQLRANIEKLGFKLSDIKIILGSHAHRDHMEADGMLKGLTGAQVMALEEDVPLLRRMSLGEPHPIDRVLKNGEEVKLGGTTLKPHLTAGHTNGCTTWTMKAQEAGKTYNVVIVCSVGYNPGYVLWKNAKYERIGDDYRNSFKTLRSLPCDIFLGAHPDFYSGADKYAKLGKGPNPYIDPAGYKAYVDLKEKLFTEEFARQQAANP
jgi:metallo-beta-lactamase class B